MIKKIILFLSISFFFCFKVIAEDKFLSLKKKTVNVRYGPSFDFPIKYIYKKINLPIKVIDKQENFRRIIDFKNNNGWIHISQLKNTKSIIILEDKILYKKSTLFSKPIVKLQKGRLLLIKSCKNEWCRVKTKRYIGWIKNNNIWGSIK
jgi:SH3-like domain-containing protein